MKNKALRIVAVLLAFGVYTVLLIALVQGTKDRPTCLLPTGESEFVPAIVEDPWYVAAGCYEELTGLDVLIMREHDGTVSTAIVVPERVESGDYRRWCELAMRILVLRGSPDVSHITVMFVNEPAQGESRYRLLYFWVCAVENRERKNCEGGSMMGGYLSPDSVRWPGRTDDGI